MTHGLRNEPEVGSALPQALSRANQEQKKADFSFKVPTRLLGSTIGKSETLTSHMLSFKFANENVISLDPDQSICVDRDGDEY